MLRNRIDLLNQIQPYVGMYFSQEYVKKNILHMTEDEIENVAKEISQEPPIETPIVPGQSAINNTQQGQG